MNTHAKIKKLSEIIHSVDAGIATTTHEITLVATDLSREEYLELTRQHLNDHPIRVSLGFLQLEFTRVDSTTGEIYDGIDERAEQPSS